MSTFESSGILGSSKIELTEPQAYSVSYPPAQLQLPSVPVAPAPASTPMRLIEMALAAGQVDQLDKLMALQERWEANEARKAFVAAMARFKAEPIIVEKDRTVDFTSQKGRTHYKHASLAAVVDAVVSRMGKYGLSHKWDTKQSDGAVQVTCVITHEMGHSESVSLAGPRDETGNKNLLQQIASTVTYLQRYTLMSLCGLASKEMDDDANNAEPVQFISADQATELRDLATESRANVTEFLKWLPAESFDTVPLSLYPKARQALKDKRDGKR